MSSSLGRERHWRRRGESQQSGSARRQVENQILPQRANSHEFGIQNSSWLDMPDPAEAFEAVKTKARWAEARGFVWFSVLAI
jgi:hypothetical protein